MLTTVAAGLPLAAVVPIAGVPMAAVVPIAGVPLAAVVPIAAVAVAAVPAKILSNEQIGHRKRTDIPSPITPPPTTFTLANTVSIQTPYGSVTLQRGTKLAFTSRDGDNVRFHYADADYEIPVSATDLK